MTTMRTRSAERTTPRGRYVEVPDRERFYVREARGPRAAPTLVLLHGLGATAALNWDGCIPLLAQRFHVVAPDHRGHGRGPRCGPRFRLEDCADDVAALVEQVGDGPVLVAGYSMGGPVAQLLCRRHPDLIAGLILCATAQEFCGSPVERLRFGVLAPVALASRLTPDVPALVPDAFRHHHLLGSLVDEMGGHQTRAVVAAAASLGAFTSCDWIDQICAPAAVVVTTDDAVVPPARQVALADVLGAPVVRLPAGHLVPHHDPRALATALIRATDQLGRRTRAASRRRRHRAA